MDRYKIQEAVYRDKEIELSGREIAVLFSELMDEIEELKTQIRNLGDKEK